MSRKDRVGVVYSTNPDFAYTEATTPEAELLPKPQQKLRVRKETAGRGGKVATVVHGFVGPADDLALLAKSLKQRLGVGGSAKDGLIVIQGDLVDKVKTLLLTAGYTNTK